METAPRNCRFLSLVVVERVLTFFSSKARPEFGRKKENAVAQVVLPSLNEMSEACLLDFYLQLEFLHLLFLLLYLQLGFLSYSGKARLISALRDCKQRNLTVSKKTPTVSNKASPQKFPPPPPHT